MSRLGNLCKRICDDRCLHMLVFWREVRLGRPVAINNIPFGPLYSLCCVYGRNDEEGWAIAWEIVGLIIVTSWELGYNIDCHPTIVVLRHTLLARISWRGNHMCIVVAAMACDRTTNFSIVLSYTTQLLYKTGLQGNAIVVSVVGVNHVAKVKLSYPFKQVQIAIEAVKLIWRHAANQYIFRNLMEAFIRGLQSGRFLKELMDSIPSTLENLIGRSESFDVMNAKRAFNYVKLVLAGNMLAATLCYICAGNIDKTVEIWSKNITAVNKGESYVGLLQDLMEKTVVLALATGRRDSLMGTKDLSPELIILRDWITLSSELGRSHIDSVIADIGHQGASVEHVRGKVLETVVEIQDHYDAAKEIDTSLLEL
nr:hypothetical protein [Tanacetum cinerariifolium]